MVVLRLAWRQSCVTLKVVLGELIMAIDWMNLFRLWIEFKKDQMRPDDVLALVQVVIKERRNEP